MVPYKSPYPTLEHMSNAWHKNSALITQLHVNQNKQQVSLIKDLTSISLFFQLRTFFRSTNDLLQVGHFIGEKAALLDTLNILSKYT